LLAACQAYAAHSGCRFILHAFEGLLGEDGTGEECLEQGTVRSVGAARKGDSGTLLAAKLSAVPLIKNFADRLREEDSALHQELEACRRVLAAESLHNAMGATFRALSLWPPSEPPRGVREDDCRYLDLTAPLHVIAQRAYNERVRRLLDVVDGMERSQRLAQTASFLMDFAQETCGILPSVPEEDQERVEKFAALVAVPGAEASPPSAGVQERIDGLLRGGERWWEDHKETVAWAATGVAATVVFAASAAASARRPGKGPARLL